MIDAPAVIVIERDMGGQLGDYIERAARYRNAGLRVEIRGECYSSCTVLVSVPNMCVGPDAGLGFHAPVQQYAGVATQTGASYFGSVMMSYYPKPLQDWIVNNGGLTQKMIYLSGTELGRMFPRCP